MRTISDAAGRLPPLSPGVQPPPYFDVDADGFVTPIDALLIINYLNGVVAAEAEGEAVDRVSPDALDSSLFAPLA